MRNKLDAAVDSDAARSGVRGNRMRIRHTPIQGRRPSVLEVGRQAPASNRLRAAENHSRYATIPVPLENTRRTPGWGQVRSRSDAARILETAPIDGATTEPPDIHRDERGLGMRR